MFLISSDSSDFVSMNFNAGNRYFAIMSAPGSNGNNGVGPVLFTLSISYDGSDAKISDIYANDNLIPEYSISDSTIKLKFKNSNSKYTTFFRVLIIKI